MYTYAIYAAITVRPCSRLANPMDCPLLICPFKTPKIYWYQNDVEVVTRVMLHDVEDHFVRVTIDRMEFSAAVNGSDYHVDLRLFGAVNAEETWHTVTGREVTMHLPKLHKGTAWPRLLASPEKSPQILVDLERLAVTKGKERSAIAWDAAQLAAYKRTHRIVNVMPDVPSSGEEDSADEGYNVIFE